MITIPDAFRTGLAIFIAKASLYFLISIPILTGITTITNIWIIVSTTFNLIT